METKNTKGIYRQVNLPYPNIYISPDPNDESYNNRTQIKHKFISSVGQSHFYIVLTVGKHYTPEEIENCNGKYLCYNCGRPIPKRIYFYPTKQNHIDVMMMIPIPHCRRECVYRTVQDMPNNDHVLPLFFLFYGPDVICAPPRFLLFVPGGLTIEEYHQIIDNQIVISEEKNGFKMFLAPVYLSCTLFKDHQLVEEAVSLIDELNQEKKESIGPNREHDVSSKSQIITLEKTPLRKGLPSQIFKIDEASFTENGQPSNNPHL